jgi:hypothetical protein
MSALSQLTDLSECLECLVNVPYLPGSGHSQDGQNAAEVDQYQQSYPRSPGVRDELL